MGFGGNIDANVFATLSKCSHGHPRVRPAIENHDRCRNRVSMRQIICDCLEDTGAKNGRAVGWAPQFYLRADGIGLSNRCASLVHVVDNDRED